MIMKEWLNVIRTLRKSKLLDTMSLEEIARDPHTNLPLQSGAFAIVKKNENGVVTVRLIIDRRPQNHYEKMVSGLEMPHASCFTKLTLGPGEMVRLSLRDASNYYYLLQAPKERLPYQGLGPCINKSWWEQGCPDWPVKDILNAPGEQVQPIFLAIAMGDLNGVVIAEEYHRQLLLQNNVIKPDEEILLGRPFPDKPATAGVCIDDLAIAQKLTPAQFKRRVEMRDSDILDKADAVYEAHN